MSELDKFIVQKLEKVEADIGDIKVTIAENTADVKHHVQRTDGLQDIVTKLKNMVEPVYQDYISKQAVETYKKTRREEIAYKLKIPGYILAAITLASMILAWLVHK